MIVFVNPDFPPKARKALAIFSIGLLVALVVAIICVFCFM